MTQVHRIRLFDYIPHTITSSSIRKNTLLIARSSGYIEIWKIKNLATCMCSFYVTTPNNIRVIRWTKYHGKKAFVVCFLSGEFYVYSYPGLQIVLQNSSYGGSVWSAAVSPNEEYFAIACDDTAIRVFDTESYSLICQPFMSSKCLSVCFDDNNFCYGGDASGRIKRIDPSNGSSLQDFKISHNYKTEGDVAVWCLVSLPDGSLASGDSNGNVTIWDVVTATVIEQFKTLQADVLTLSTNKGVLYASGIDPTVVSYKFDGGRWVRNNQKSFHTYDVTTIVSNDFHVVSAGHDACIKVKKYDYLIKPFQVKTPVAQGYRNNGVHSEIVVVGSEQNYLSVWTLNEREAKQELKLKAKQNIESVSISKDGTTIAYSADCTRILHYENGHWSFDEEKRPKSTALCFSNSKNLYSVTINGDVINGKDLVSLKTPLFALTVTDDERYIVVGGLKKMYSLNADLKGDIKEMPYFGAPFSAFCFQPAVESRKKPGTMKNQRRLFVCTGDKKVFVYHITKQKLISKLSISLEKYFTTVSPFSLSFDMTNPNRLMISSSQITVLAPVNPKRQDKFALRYNDYLFAEFAQNGQIILFEKPWESMTHALPKPFRVKRFQGSEDTKYIRY